MGCRFMTSFHGVVDRAQVKPGEWVVVHGCGGIGLSAINIAAAMGANVIGVDIESASLELAKGMGAAHVINAKKTIRSMRFSILPAAARTWRSTRSGSLPPAAIRS